MWQRVKFFIFSIGGFICFLAGHLWSKGSSNKQAIKELKSQVKRGKEAGHEANQKARDVNGDNVTDSLNQLFNGKGGY